MTWEGAESLREFLRPIDELRRDPRNARRHSPRNIAAIQASLARFGQLRPVVVRGDVIAAGNGTHEAAALLSWTHLAAVDASHLTEQEIRAFGIADNRTAELAEWHFETLIEEAGNLPDDLLRASGFNEEDWERLTSPPAPVGSNGESGTGTGSESSPATDQFGVIVLCRDEDHQRAVFEELTAAGHQVRVVVT